MHNEDAPQRKLVKEGGREGREGRKGGWGEKVVKGAECECGKLKTDACFSFLSVLVLGIGHGYIDRYLMCLFFYAQSTANGYTRVKPNVFLLPQV